MQFILLHALPCLFLQYPLFIFHTLPAAKDLEVLDEKLGILETYLSKTTYSAGDHFTIADFSIVATLNTIEISGHDLTKFPKILKYLEKCRAEIKDYKETNEKDLEAARQWMAEGIKLAKAAQWTIQLAKSQIQKLGLWSSRFKVCS